MTVECLRDVWDDLPRPSEKVTSTCTVVWTSPGLDELPLACRVWTWLETSTELWPVLLWGAGTLDTTEARLPWYDGVGGRDGASKELDD